MGVYYDALNYGYGMPDINSSILPKERNPNISWKVTTNPTVEPITVTELKGYARIDGNSEDSILSSIIIGTRMLVENYLNRALIEQVITLQMDYWPSRTLYMPRPPLLSVTSITTLDESDVETTYSSSNYYTVTNSPVGSINVKESSSIPTNTIRWTQGIKVVYKAGYGSTASLIPQAIKEGVKVWAAMIYDNRTNSDQPPPIAERLLSYYRIMNV
jgi:uncharacterized phiE125 gp8 family phage protein